jgi:hypothetical protein
LNYRIISAAGLDGGRPGPITDYLGFIAEYLEKGEYSLVDFPQVYFQFRNLNDPHVISRAGRAGSFGRALPYAIAGFQDYVLRDFRSARGNFYKCLALLKNNGPVHYYLYLTTSGALAAYHKNKSAATGYYPARVGTGAALR